MSTSTVRVISTRGQSVSSGTFENNLRTNYLLDFVNPQRQEAFISFKVEQFGRIFFNFLVAAGLTIGLVLYWVLALVGNPGPDTIVLSICTLFFVIMLAWYLAYVKKYHFRDLYVERRLSFTVLENLFMVAFSLVLDFIVLQRTLIGACKSTAFLDIWHCNLAAPLRGMPIDSSICAIFVPLICAMTLPLVRGKIALMCYLVNNGFIFILIGVFGATSAISILLICTIIAVSVHLMYTYSQVLLFIYFVKTQTLQQQREEDAELKAQEMRHVIGKVAHDLKTPLSSLTYGLDSLKDTMDKVKRQPSSDTRHPFSVDRDSSVHASGHQTKWSPTSSKSSLSPSNVSVQVLNDFKYALEGMQASHLQVMMILNRCIDYSTIANGLSLVPRTAPVSILHMVYVALHWANKVYDNREVLLEKTELHGATTMATDPVWLQDNLLCLVSNALKFSGTGEIKLRITKGDMNLESWMNRSVVGSRDSPLSNRSLRPRVSFRDEPPLVIESSLSSRQMGSRERENSKEATKSSPKSMISSFSSTPWSAADDDLELGLGELAIVVEEGGSSSSSSDEDHTREESLAAPRPHIFGHAPISTVDHATLSASTVEGVRFEVEDPGHAIGADTAARLFLPSDNGAERSVGGSGLGLFCLAERVKALGGQYGLVSPLQRNVDGILGNDYGNLFWFLLPYLEATSSSFDRQEMEKLTGKQHLESKSLCGMHATSAQGSLAYTFANIPLDNAKPEDSASPQRSSSSQLQSLNVLIVDDSPLILKMLKAALQKRGHCVTVTTNGYEALDMIKQGWQKEDELLTLAAKGMQPTPSDYVGEVKLESQSTSIARSESTDVSTIHPTTRSASGSLGINTNCTDSRSGAYDVMLLDIQMPIIDGLQVMHKYHTMWADFQHERGSTGDVDFIAQYGLVIIAMSANNDPAAMEGASQAGVDFFFAKPFDIDSFQRVVRKFIPRI